MNILLIIIALFVFSLALALRSMKDLNVPQEIHRMIRNKKYKGKIVFFKDKKVKHYSSSSSSRSSG
ncbi:MAG: hypothetical protein NTZ55_04545 [Candidatus Roizmanbacteria bacterium]|nr:hypothetical protein [Candidatus Roizmanbacteria bacterium]